MDLVDLVDDEIGLSGDDGNDVPAQRLQEVELELAQARGEACCRCGRERRSMLPWPKRRHSTFTPPYPSPPLGIVQVEHEVEVLLARQAALQTERERLTRAIAVERRAPRADWTGTFPWVGCPGREWRMSARSMPCYRKLLPAGGACRCSACMCCTAGPQPAPCAFPCSLCHPSA